MTGRPHPFLPRSERQLRHRSAGSQLGCPASSLSPLGVRLSSQGPHMLFSTPQYLFKQFLIYRHECRFSILAWTLDESPTNPQHQKELESEKKKL